MLRPALAALTAGVMALCACSGTPPQPAPPTAGPGPVSQQQLADGLTWLVTEQLREQQVSDADAAGRRVGDCMAARLMPALSEESRRALANADTDAFQASSTANPSESDRFVDASLQCAAAHT